MSAGADGAWAPHLAAADDRREMGDGPRRALGEVVPGFVSWQARRWPRLARALDDLEAVRTRDVRVGGRTVTLQWNPGRAASTTARVEAGAVAARPCFLCPRNLPPEERGLAHGDDLVLLANPAPVAPLHLVASHRDHVPQALEPVLRPALELARATAGVLTVFYNGPRCGASAPDHLHLQALSAGSTPDERSVTCRLAGCGREPVGRELVRRPGLHGWLDDGSSRCLVVLQGLLDPVDAALRDVLEELGRLDDGTSEPPLNLLLSAEGVLLTALLYPRGAHRPACYHAEGAARRLISPGAVDMAGLVIAVRREDFEALGAADLARIFEETALDRERTAALERALRARWSDG